MVIRTSTEVALVIKGTDKETEDITKVIEITIKGKEEIIKTKTTNNIINKLEIVVPS